MSIRIAAILATVASPAFADVPRVATDIPPVHGLVARVMDGIGAPDLVVPPAASAHSHDLRPSEASILDRADVVFWIGSELSPWLEGPVGTLAADAVVVSLLDVDVTALLPFREIEAFGEPDHDHDHDHDHGNDDPHAWLDPANAQAWLGVIAETLASADPDNAAGYRENATAARSEIATATSAASDTLGDTSDIAYVVFHDAYQYFEGRFGLSPRGAVTLGDAAAPGPARIAEVQKQLRDFGVDCLLIEPQAISPLVDLVTDGADIKRVEIDPLGVNIPPGPNHYPALLASLSGSFAACR